MSAEEFDKLTPPGKKRYAFIRHPVFFPLAGFIYVLFNPRFNWVKETAQVIYFIIKAKLIGQGGSISRLFNEYKASSWKTQKEYFHQCVNNIVLFVIYSLFFMYSEMPVFLLLYVLSTSVAGGVGILFFTVQHNYEYAYAAETEQWDYYKGALEGARFLILPRALNWISADIAYHPIHHLSTAIPNYRLAQCQRDLTHLFTHVKRVHLHEVLPSLKYILWDKDQEKIISIAEYQSQDEAGGVDDNRMVLKA